MWMDLENIMLSKMSDRGQICDIPDICSLNNNTNEFIYKTKYTHRYRAQTWSDQRAEGRGRMDWEFGVSRYKLLYREWINKVLLYALGAMFNIL